MSTRPDPDDRRWPPGSAVGLGVVLGAALGLTVFHNLALSTGTGLVVGAVVDLMHLGRPDGR